MSRTPGGQRQACGGALALCRRSSRGADRLLCSGRAEAVRYSSGRGDSCGMTALPPDREHDQKKESEPIFPREDAVRIPFIFQQDLTL